MSNETENHEFRFSFGQATLELNSVLNTAEGMDCQGFHTSGSKVNQK